MSTLDRSMPHQTRKVLRACWPPIPTPTTFLHRIPMAVPVKIGPTFEPGVAAPLFDTNVTGFFPYDVSPDGRFLLNTISEAAALTASPVTIVLNWQAGLRR